MKAWICVFLLIAVFSACGVNNATEELVKENSPVQMEEEVPEQETAEPQYPEAPEEAPVESVPEETVPDELPFAAYEAEGVWIYFPNEEGTDLASERLDDEIDMAALIEEMKQKGLMVVETEILELSVGTATTVYEDGNIVSSKPSNTLRAQLELSEEYLRTFEGSTSAREDRLKVRALANTLLKYLEADELVLLCNGEPIETEYCDFKEVLYFVDPQ